MMIAGQGKGHQLSGLKAGDTWLEFGVVFKGEEGMHWVREELLSCDRLVHPCSVICVTQERCLCLIKTSCPGDAERLIGHRISGSRHRCFCAVNCYFILRRLQSLKKIGCRYRDAECLTGMAVALQLAPFVQKMRDSGYIPLPGDVDIIMGGPPCQGVSGLNRHGKTKEIIDDPRCGRSKMICWSLNPAGLHCYSCKFRDMP